MPKKINFDKYQKRSPDYHWQQVSRNIFRLNAYVLARYQQGLAWIPPGNDLKILDVGCGDGVLLNLIGKGRLYGVDLDQDSLNYAASKMKAKLVRAGAEKLPFRNSFFDVVIATEIIEHLKRPEKLLIEAFRVLKRGGRLILTTPVQQPEGLTDRLHIKEFSLDELKVLCGRYFNRLKIITSHPRWLKRFYIWRWGHIGRFYCEPGRWLINGLVLFSGWNPFLSGLGKPTQQLAVCKK